MGLTVKQDIPIVMVLDGYIDAALRVLN